MPGRFAKLKAMTDTQQQISRVCDDVKNLLLQKNKKYGDSALNPSRIFSKADTSEQLCVRIDDKLSRIAKGAGLLATDEDVLQDLIGYLVLLKISISRDGNTKAAQPAPVDQWDGSDIEPYMKSWAEFWNTQDRRRVDALSSDDAEVLELHTSGDRFG
jgi:hypothetical protein